MKMTRVAEIVANIISIAVLACLAGLVALLVWTFWPHYAHTAGAVRCVYRYEYNDENDVRRQDVVEVGAEDCRLLAAMFAGRAFREALDLEKGFTPEYSLEFFDAAGNATMVLIQYGQDGTVRIPGTQWDYQFARQERDLLFSTLESYHRFDDVLLAG